MTIVATCGAGFIGANFLFGWLAQSTVPLFNVDKPITAGNLETLADLADDTRNGCRCDCKEALLRHCRAMPL